MKIYSIIFFLKNKIGHNYSYNKSIEEIANLNNCMFEAIIPKKSEIEKKNWKKELQNLFPTKEGRFFSPQIGEKCLLHLIPYIACTCNF